MEKEKAIGGEGPVRLHTVVLGRRTKQTKTIKGKEVQVRRKAIVGVGTAEDGTEVVIPLSVRPSGEIPRSTIDEFLRHRPDLREEILRASRAWKRRTWNR